MGHLFQDAMAGQGILTVSIDSQSPWQNGKPNELELPSNFNCGIWTKNVISKARKSLKAHAPSVAMPGTVIVTDPVTQLTNEYSAHR